MKDYKPFPLASPAKDEDVPSVEAPSSAGETGFKKNTFGKVLVMHIHCTR